MACSEGIFDDLTRTDGVADPANAKEAEGKEVEQGATRAAHVDVVQAEEAAHGSQQPDVGHGALACYRLDTRCLCAKA